ncbi:MAG: hypothetical protein LC737_06430 [Chloroflexi bacterium]|nr:hypothetical protein [Chloroflexota bacterium]
MNWRTTSLAVVLCFAFISAACDSPSEVIPLFGTPLPTITPTETPTPTITPTPAPTATPTVTPTPTPVPTLTVEQFQPKLIGKWKIAFARIYYDQSGTNPMNTDKVADLELRADTTWQSGDMKGRWSAARVTSDDWARWKSSPYGPTNKVVLQNWNGTQADGPIEQLGDDPDAVVVIFHAAPPQVSAAGTVWYTFGPSK